MTKSCKVGRHTGRVADVLGALAVLVEQFATDGPCAFAQRRFGPRGGLLQHQQLNLAFNQLELSDEQFLLAPAQRLLVFLLIDDRSVQILLASLQLLHAPANSSTVCKHVSASYVVAAFVPVCVVSSLYHPRGQSVTVHAALHGPSTWNALPVPLRNDELSAISFRCQHTVFALFFVCFCVCVHLLYVCVLCVIGVFCSFLRRKSLYN